VRFLLSALSLALVGWTPLPRVASTPQPLVLPQPLETFGRYARVASDGRGFFVVSGEFGRGKDPEFGTGFNPQFGMAFDDRGEPLQDDVSNASGLGTSLSAVASSGANYLMVWFDDTEAPRIYARRISGEGRPIDETPIVVHQFDRASIFASLLDLSVAWDGRQYVIAYEKKRGIHGVKVVSETGVPGASEAGALGSEVAANRSGSILLATHQTEEIDDERPLIVESLNVGPAEIGRGSQAVLAASSGDDFLIAYRFERDLRVQRLDSRAQPIGDPVMISSRSSEPSVTWAGDHWLVVFTKAGTPPSVQGVRVGRESAGTPFVIADNASIPAVASNGTRELVTWLRGDGIRQKAILDGTAVSNIGPVNRQLAAASVAGIAAMGRTGIIGQTRNAIYGDVDVWAVRGGIVDHIHTFPGPVQFEAVAGAESHALVVTGSTDQFQFHVVDGTGNVLAESVFDLTATPFDVAAYWVGMHYLVTWNQEISGQTVPHAVTVDAAARTGRRQFIATATKVARAAVSDRVLTVAAQQNAPYTGVIEGPEIGTIPLGKESDPERTIPLAAASDGHGFLVLFAAEDLQMKVQRIEPDGTRGTSRILPAAASRSTRTLLGWTGEYFLLLRWTPGDPVVTALRVEPGGRLIDREFEPVCAIPALRYGNVPALLVRELNQLEIVSGTPAQPFGSPGKTWLRLGMGGSTRRRAVR
jgi:hypothetical protein